MKIKHKIVLAAGALISVLLLIQAGISQMMIRKELTSNAIERLDSEVESKAMALKELMFRTHEDLYTLKAHKGLEDYFSSRKIGDKEKMLHAETELEAFFIGISLAKPQYSKILLATSDLSPVLHVAGGKRIEHLSTEYYELAEVRQMLEHLNDRQEEHMKSHKMIHEVYMDKKEGLMLVFGSFLDVDGAKEGFVLVSYPIENHIKQLFSDESITSIHYVVIDESGNLIASPSHGYEDIHAGLAAEELSDWLVSSERIPSLGIKVIMGIQKTKAFAVINDLFIIGIVVLIVAVLFSILFLGIIARNITNPIIVELEKKNFDLDNNRVKLQSAVDEIHSLLQNVIWNDDFNIGLHNPNLKNCYETLNCKNDKCSCYGMEPVRCWQVVGTFCGGKITGDFTTKQEDCMKCTVFLEATADPVYRIREHFNNMMHVIEIKNRELEEAYKEISYSQVKAVQQEKMATIGQLAAGVAHEINNPTGFISSNLGTLGNYLNKLSEFIAVQNAALEFVEAEETVENMKEMRRKLKIDYVLEDVEDLIRESLDGADRIKNIVQNLKTFARIDEKEYKHTDINECIESTLNIVWNELKYKATVEKEYGEIPLTKCYHQQINQVIMNLLVNAGHAIEKQGEIKIKTWNGDDFINVSISDSGAGIPEDKLEQIFEPFFTTKEVGKGTGLGLSISHEIVQKHNGEFLVQSEVGKGTTFIVKIPVVKDGPDNIQTESADDKHDAVVCPADEIFKNEISQDH